VHVGREDDLVFLDFFAGAGIVRPKRDPSRRAYSFRLIHVVIRSKPRRRSFGDVFSSDLVLQIAKTLIIPATIRFQTELATNVGALKAAGVTADTAFGGGGLVPTKLAPNWSPD
jgi:hypothetical protein